MKNSKKILIENKEISDKNNINELKLKIKLII
jgi:hypothetical protein